MTTNIIAKRESTYEQNHYSSESENVIELMCSIIYGKLADERQKVGFFEINVDMPTCKHIANSHGLTDSDINNSTRYKSVSGYLNLFATTDFNEYGKISSSSMFNTNSEVCKSDPNKTFFKNIINFIMYPGDCINNVVANFTRQNQSLLNVHVYDGDAKCSFLPQDAPTLRPYQGELIFPLKTPTSIKARVVEDCASAIITNGLICIDATDFAVVARRKSVGLHFSSNASNAKGKMETFLNNHLCLLSSSPGVFAIFSFDIKYSVSIELIDNLTGLIKDIVPANSALFFAVDYKRELTTEFRCTLIANCFSNY
jgi:hypothetical protein